MTAKRAPREIYVVSIPRGSVVDANGKRLSREQVRRAIRRIIEGGDERAGIDFSGVKVWPETSADTARIAAGLGLSFAAPHDYKPGQRVRLLDVKLPGAGGPTSPELTIARVAAGNGASGRPRGTTGALRLRREEYAPERRGATMVRTHARRRKSARARS